MFRQVCSSYIKILRDNGTMTDKRVGPVHDIQLAAQWALSRLAEPAVYTQWSDEYARQNSFQVLEEFHKYVVEKVDLAALPPSELRELGFSLWDEGSNLFLVPLHLVGALTPGTRLYGIDGEEAIVGKDKIDLNVRMGCIAYGIRTASL